MLPYVVAGGAAGALSIFFGLPLVYAAFLALTIVGVLVGINLATTVTVKVPPAEHKTKKAKPDKTRKTTPNAADAEIVEKSEKSEKSEETKAESKAASNKRDKERAKKAAKKEAEAEAARAAAAKAERERLEAEAASKRADEEESAKKKKKKKKKAEEKESSAAPVVAEKKAPVKQAESVASKTIETVEPVERKSESKTDYKEPLDVWEDVKVKKGKREVPEVTSTSTAAVSNEFKVEIDVSLKNYAVIVGQKGATLKLIIDATQTTIDCKKDEGRVIVAGQSRESVNKAAEAIRQLNAHVCLMSFGNFDQIRAGRI